MDQPPSDRRYTKEHEWIMIDGDIATIGITEFAQSELGDVTYVEVPQVGQAIVHSRYLAIAVGFQCYRSSHTPPCSAMTFHLR